MKRAKAEFGKASGIERVLLIDGAATDLSALLNSNPRLKIQVVHDLSHACRALREGEHDLVIAGPPLNSDHLQRIISGTGGQPAGRYPLSMLRPLCAAKDPSQFLAGLVAVTADFLEPHRIFALPCNELTGEPDLESIETKPDPGPVLRTYLEASGEHGPQLWMVPVVHDSHLEALLGMVCPQQPDETSGAKLETLRVLAKTSGPLMAGLREAQRLRRTVDDFEAVFQIHSQLISNVCHDFRSALAAVRGYAKRIQDGRSGAVSDAQLEDLAVIQRNTSKLLNLVSHTLPFVAEQRLRVATFDLRETWWYALKRVRFRLSEKRITVREQIPAEPFTVTADRQRMETIFEMILTNLIHLANSQGEITAQFARVNGEVTARIIVAGTVLPPQLLERIFEHQATSPPAAEPVSARIAGLSLVHDMIWLHGGRLAVTSTPDEGTMLVISLPPPAAGQEKALPH